MNGCSRTKKGYEEAYGVMPLYELPYHLSKTEKKIYDFIKSGETLHCSKFKNLKYKRNCLRKILLNKLKQWEINPNKSKPEYTFGDILEKEQSKKVEMG